MAGDKTVLVVGGGISGITAAVEAAEAGCKVILVERLPYLGGRVARMNKYFPKLCPPTCGLEINFRRIRQNPDITVYTLGEVESVSGTPGNLHGHHQGHRRDTWKITPQRASASRIAQ